MPGGAEPGQANEASRLRLEILAAARRGWARQVIRRPGGPQDRGPALVPASPGLQVAPRRRAGRGAQSRPQSPGKLQGAGLIPEGEHGETPVRKRVTLGRDLQADGRGKEGRAFEVRVRVQGTSQEGLRVRIAERRTQVPAATSEQVGPGPAHLLSWAVKSGEEGRPGTAGGRGWGTDPSPQRQESPISNFKETQIKIRSVISRPQKMCRDGKN